MIPCPNCRGRDLRTTNVATTLWPTPMVNRLRSCKTCGSLFETLEVHGKIIKAPPLTEGKKYEFPNERIITNVLRQMAVGDYMIAMSHNDRIKFTNSMNKIYGSGCHRTRKIKKTDTYHCMRIK